MKLLSLATVSAFVALSGAQQCTTGRYIRDHSFESGVTPSSSGGPWTVYNITGSASYALTKPGSPQGGQYAFTASLVSNLSSNPVAREILNQTLATCPGRNYSVFFDYRFASTSNNNCFYRIEYPLGNITGSVTDGSGTPGEVAGRWTTTAVLFAAASYASTLRIIFQCSHGASNAISVDNFDVAIFNGNAY